MDDQLGVLVESLRSVNDAAVQQSFNTGVVIASLILLATTLLTVFTDKSMFLKVGGALFGVILIFAPAAAGDSRTAWEKSLAGELSAMYPSANITVDTVKDLKLGSIDFSENQIAESHETTLIMNSSPSSPDQLLKVTLTPVVEDGHLRLFLDESTASLSLELPRVNQFSSDQTVNS